MDTEETLNQQKDLHDSIQIIEQRVAHLEQIAGIDKLKNKSGTINISNMEPIGKKLADLEKKLKNFKLYGLSQFLKKMEQLDSLVKNGNNFTQYYLQNSHKGKVLCLLHRELLDFFGELKKIKTLQKYIDFAPVYEIDIKTAQLNKIEALAGENLEKAYANSQRLDELIKIQAEVVDGINKKLLYYDYILSALTTKK